MAAAGSLKPFYIALGAIAVVGGALIARQAMGRGGDRLPSLSAAALPPLPVGPRGVVLGSDSAPVHITEFADFECPWCARFAVLTFPDIRRDLIETGKVQWRFVHFPLDGHQYSPYAHLAAACANDQGKFWPMFDAIYNSQGDWVGASHPDRALRDVAQRVGLDMPRYDDCVKNQTAWPQVLADKAYGDSVGLSGTPTFLIDGHKVEATPTADQLTTIVDSLIRVHAAAPAHPAAGRR